MAGDELMVLPAVFDKQATAQRHDLAPYRALFTSVYARRDGTWRLMLHQQTPDPEGV